MVEKVNAKLPKEQQFDPFWWYAPRHGGSFRSYFRQENFFQVREHSGGGT
jgi:hypothetical protein